VQRLPRLLASAAYTPAERSLSAAAAQPFREASRHAERNLVVGDFTEGK
jgi:hypothetical protein